MRTLLLALTALLCLPVSVSAQSGEFLTFGEVRQYFDHWLGVCPGNGACRLVGGVPDPDESFFWAQRVSIDFPEGDGTPMISLFLGNEVGCEEQAAIGITFTNGTLVTAESGMYQNTCNTFAITDPAQVETMIEAMKAAGGMKVELGYDSFTRKQEGYISLKGVTAGLAWIEARRSDP